MESNKKVILINGTTSNWYEQVIFILKPTSEKKVPVNLINEAEKIINEYISLKYSDKEKYINPFKEKNISTKNNKKTIRNQKVSKARVNYILNISIFCSLVLIGFLLYKICF